MKKERILFINSYSVYKNNRGGESHPTTERKKMKKLKELVNQIGFEYEREDKAVKAIEIIFNLVASRDFDGMKKLTQTKLGSAFLDIAEEYGANTSGTMAKWHWYENNEGKIIRYSKEFKNGL